MKTNRSKKGFTLMELIIVIAIIGILLSVMIPTWGYFITKSRERNANSKAKIIFTAAQTEITRIAARERTMDADDQYITNGDFYFYSHNGNGAKCNADGSALSDTENAKYAPSNASFGRAVARIADEEGFYKIFVHNYIVQSVIYCNVESGRYKGTYPMTTDQLSEDDLDTVRSGDVNEMNMSLMVFRTEEGA
ncbi:prepilin-type N-terminal cleavage/methylation domain-containing protein [Ruminococcus sp.]